MSGNKIRTKQAYFWESWNNKVARKNIEKSYVPDNRKEAYNIQECYEIKSKEKLFGWKIAATSKEGQLHIGVNSPIAGRLIRERLFGSNQIISLNNNRMKLVEAEFAFKLLNDFYPKESDYKEQEILENVECAYPAIEIPDSRILNYDKVGENLLIADNACAGEYVIGEKPVKSFKHIDFKSFEVNCYKNNRLFSRGVGSNVLGSPIIALTWLINELNFYKIKLLGGQVILTGTCIKPFSVEPGDEVLMDFHELGKVNCSFI